MGRDLRREEPVAGCTRSGSVIGACFLTGAGFRLSEPEAWVALTVSECARSVARLPVYWIVAWRQFVQTIRQP